MRYNPFSHIGLKAVSIALAMLLWLSVASEEVVERGLRVPLELQNLPATLEMVELTQETVDVRLRGPSGTLSRLVAGDVVAVIDLGVATPGRRLFQLSPDRVRAPFDVQVTQISPSTVSIRLEASAAKIVPVAPAIEGDPAPGYVVGTITSEPATVEVVGAESVVRRVTEAVTESVPVKGATAAVRQSVTIGVPDPGVRLATPQSARVTVAIVPAPVERVLQNVPVRLRNAAGGLSVRAVPPVVQVGVRGSKESLAGVQVDSVTAYVDVAGLGPGQYRLPVRLDPTKGFGVENLEPGTVAIEIK
jgi:YbbR domain-containing protein